MSFLQGSQYDLCNKVLLLKLVSVDMTHSFEFLLFSVPDGKPVIGPVPGMLNLFLAAGHEGGGLSMVIQIHS